jgi:4-amino-4-deoxy-L-arabinose transferase-like glycosyltransferase
MREQLLYGFWIVAAAAVIFFVNLGGARLWDMDEAMYTSCAREMHERGDWVVPMFNGRMFPEKPALMFWTMLIGFELFGVNEFAARFFSALLGVATALVTFQLGRLLFKPRIGFWAGMITVSTIIFTVSARAATVDSALTFLTTAAFCLFAMAVVKSRSSLPAEVGSNDASAAEWSKSPWIVMVLMYACLGAAVLAKGPVGLLLPLGAMGLFLLFERGWRNLLRSAWWMRPFSALLVVAIVAVPWYLWVGLRTDWQWPRQFLLEFNLRPLRKPIQGHGDVTAYQRAIAVLLSVFYRLYHVPAVMVGFFPWAVFLGPTLLDTVQRIRRRDRGRSGVVLLSCWFGTWFIFWSICKTKLPHYLLPAYPALALLTGCFVDRWLSEPASVKPWWLRNAWIWMILVGVSMMIALPIVAARYMPGEGILGLVGLVPLLGGAWCWWATARGRHQAAVIGFALSAVVFLTAIFGFASLRVDRHQNAPSMLAAIRADGAEPATVPLATYGFFRESIVYYAHRAAGRPVTLCDSMQQLRQFLDRPGRCYVITKSEYESGIQAAFAGRLRLIDRERLFLGDGDDVVVLAGTYSDAGRGRYNAAEVTP